MRQLIQTIRSQLHTKLDELTHELIRYEHNGFAKDPQRYSKTKLATPEEDVKRLIISAKSLEEVWDFLNKRLRTGSAPEFILFSVVDEMSDLLRLRFLSPQREDKVFHGEFIPLCDTENHLVKTVARADTTFTDQLQDLGRELYPYLSGHENQRHNVFSIPLVAANRTIAVITLGFDQLDSFSQAKLSYVYLLRDQLAQLVWNLILHEQIQNQPQMDNLTGLMTHSSFHQVFKKELRRAKLECFPLSLLLVDINDLRSYNEANSHQMGDRAIAHLASLIKHQVRGIDTVARYGPDEIAVLLCESHPNDAEIIAQRFVTAVQEQSRTVKPFTISIGVAGFPSDARDVDDLIQLAENAMFYGRFQSESSSRSSIMMAADLEKAPEHERVDVFMAQMARKYGDSGSDLFKQVLAHMESRAASDADAATLETVASLAGAMDAKDKYTRGHSQSVSNYAVALASALDLPPGEVERIRLAAFFHDIGKIGIPESILNKPGPLTPEERDIMKQHPVIGARQILKPVTALRDIVPLVEYHHEAWDGSGHPMGLKGENIPLGARIVSIVDAFHALTSNRPYRDAMPLEDAIAILQEGAGKTWDPGLVEKFVEMLRKARAQNAPARSFETTSSALKI